MAQYVQPRQLARMLQSEPRPTVIDVRGEESYWAGHLPDARHIPAEEVERRLSEIPRDRPVVAY